MEGIDPLIPPMESFKNHIPRIEDFWKSQLLGVRPKVAYDLVKKHKGLLLRKGELDRWILLLLETIDELAPEYSNVEGLNFYIQTWKRKVDHFRLIFVKSLLS